MDWQKRLEAALDCLEDALEGKLDLEEVAKQANCSTFHFCRLFEMVTGLGPGEYLRRRRLSEAALALSSGEERVLDLALRFGWESPDAFSRAFRREFGCLPSEARRGSVPLHSYPRIQFSVVLKGDKPMEYRIERGNEIRLTGISIRVGTKDGINFTTVPGFWDNVISDGRWEQLVAKADWKSLGVCGICRDFDWVKGEFTYSIAVDTPAVRAGLPEGCADFIVPASTWGKFIARGPVRPNLQDTIKRIWAEWMPSCDWEHAGTAEVEYYGPLCPDDPNYYSEYWVPLKKK